MSDAAAAGLSAEGLFFRHFFPHYPPEIQKDLAAARRADANPAKNPSFYARLAEIAEVFTVVAPRALGASPEELKLDFSGASVHRLGARLTREARDRLLEAEEILPFSTHAAVYVGECVVRRHGGSWQVRKPLWESQVRLESRAGTGDLAVFQWVLKSLSDDEIDRAPLGARYRTHVEVPTFDPEALPVLAPPDRRLPRLAKARYDTLYKHLRAHLPELRDVGKDFPSPERFADFGFKWLDFQLLGGGKMLLLWGPGKHGAHLFWLDREGFQKHAFYPSDGFPEPQVRVHEERGMLSVVVSVEGQMRVHETLWWGA